MDAQLLNAIVILLCSATTLTACIRCRTNPARGLTLLLIGAFTCYSALFILRASLVVDGVRYFTLFDDAMISMRYARNLAEGYGLVWNPGEPPVEGYTNFLWTVYMAAWHMLPISSAKAALPIQITGLIFLISALWMVYRITERLSNNNYRVVGSAVLLTASYQTITYWGLKGMETSILGFLMLVYVWRALQILEQHSFDPLLWVLLGLGLLIRPDMLIPYMGILLYLVLAVPQHRRKNIIVALLILVLIQGVLTAFRLAYYDAWLPNTYYLKMTGISTAVRIARGWMVGHDFIRGMSYLLFCLTLCYCAIRRSDRRIMLLGYLFAIQFFYSIYVGGDAWEWWGHLANRYLCIVMPLFLILLACAATTILGWCARLLRLRPVLHNVTLACLLLWSIITLHSGFGPGAIRQLVAFSKFQTEQDKNNVRLALKIREITDPDAVIAVGWAGAMGYFTRRTCIDLLGKNDAVIARRPSRAKTAHDFDPGHHKYDWIYSLSRHAPDLVLDYNPEWYTPEEKAYFVGHYKTLRLSRGDSARFNSRWTIFMALDSTKVDQTAGSIGPVL